MPRSLSQGSSVRVCNLTHFKWTSGDPDERNHWLGLRGTCPNWTRRVHSQWEELAEQDYEVHQITDSNPVWVPKYQLGRVAYPWLDFASTIGSTITLATRRNKRTVIEQSLNKGVFRPTYEYKGISSTRWPTRERVRCAIDRRNAIDER